jgi:hypothetical protein
MSAQQAPPHTTATLARLHEFLRDKASIEPCLAEEERAKVGDLCADVTRLRGARWFPVAAGFGRVFSAFESVSSLWVRGIPGTASLTEQEKSVMKAARPQAFADDYAMFDHLSILYGGLFRGSVIVNYLLGVVAVGVTLASILPQPNFVSWSGTPLVPEFSWHALRMEFACILIIGVIFCYGQTPHAESASEVRGWRRGLSFRRFAHRWHERWLEYRVLAERFRYLELMLPLSLRAPHLPPFSANDGEDRWYDRYFVWRTEEAKLPHVDTRGYRERALALMHEQIDHHTANSIRRGAIAARLHRIAVSLFFASLLLCLVDLAFEAGTRSCHALHGPANWCYVVGVFNGNLKSIIEFLAILAPVVAAAIHGVLATTEYTKVAESSRRTAARIESLIPGIEAFISNEHPANSKTLESIHDAIFAFADATINEASQWREMLRDKNIPLA